MKKNKPSPLENLYRKKARLQTRADALAQNLETRLEYLQQNLGSIAGNTLKEIIASQTKPLFGSFFQKKESAEASAFFRWSPLLIGALELLPLFVQKPQRAWIRCAVSLVKKWLFGESGTGKRS
jgi:hypothetical protein